MPGVTIGEGAVIGPGNNAVYDWCVVKRCLQVFSLTKNATYYGIQFALEHKPICFNRLGANTYGY